MRPTLLPLLLIALAAPAVAAPAADPAEAMRQAAAVYAREMQGVVAYMVHSESRVRAPMIRQDSRSIMWVAVQNGTPMRARVLRLFREGKPNDAERRKLEERTNAGFKRGRTLFDAPYDGSFTADYAFSLAEGERCGPGELAIAFSSAKRDEHHGTGALVLTGEGHVKRMRFRPNVYPQHVTEGEVLLERGPVLPDLWSTRSLTVRYRGGVGPVKGSFDLKQRFEQYRRFTSVDAAMAAAPTLP